MHCCDLAAGVGGAGDHREIQYERIWPEDGPTSLPRKAVFTLQFRSLDSWPLSITWAIEDSSSAAGHLSLLSAALTPTTSPLDGDSSQTK